MEPQMSGPTGIEIWAKGTGAFPARRDVADQAWFKEKKLFQAFVRQMQLRSMDRPGIGPPDRTRWSATGSVWYP